jgi:hypothetical protein
VCDAVWHTFTSTLSVEGKRDAEQAEGKSRAQRRDLVRV